MMLGRINGKWQWVKIERIRNNAATVMRRYDALPPEKRLLVQETGLSFVPNKRGKRIINSQKQESEV
jgi:hypothetical protein